MQIVGRYGPVTDAELIDEPAFSKLIFRWVSDGSAIFHLLVMQLSLTSNIQTNHVASDEAMEGAYWMTFC